VIELITGALIDNPRRVGKPLHGNLAGIHSAPRGTYRVLYRINESEREIIVVHIENRQNVYRST
jgi:mRNA-degrading endonuclease RelE of RelBE toxin-antitoxin system